MSEQAQVEKSSAALETASMPATKDVPQPTKQAKPVSKEAAAPMPAAPMPAAPLPAAKEVAAQQPSSKQQIATPKETVAGSTPQESEPQPAAKAPQPSSKQQNAIPTEIAKLETRPVEAVYNTDKERRLAEFVKDMEIKRIANSAIGRQHETNAVIETLTQESEKVEDQIKTGENEIFRKNEEAFHMAADEREVVNLRVKQKLEVVELQSVQEQKIQDIKKRKASKKFTRATQREVKELYLKTHEQDLAYKITNDVKKTFSDHRERTEMLVGHIEARHLVQNKQFTAAESRRIQDTRALTELQCKNLSEDQRNAIVKECNSKLNHRLALDKKRLDHIRDKQRMELRHFKEKSDAETRMTEEFSNMRARHVLEENTLKQSQRQSYAAEKEGILDTRTSLKVMEITVENKIELTRLQAVHRIQLRQALRAQRARKSKRSKMWSAVLDRDVEAKANGSSGASSVGSMSGSASVQGKSVSASQSQSQAHSRHGSNGSINKQMSDHADASKVMEDHSAEDADDFAMMNSQELEKQQAKAQLQIQEMTGSLKAFQQKNEADLADLKQRHQQEIKKTQDDSQKFFMEMEWRQDIETKDLQKANDAEIAEALIVQERELEMEGYIRGAETKALQERRVLNSLLDSVVDGVISIDPRGKIKRFNAAAEKMFGYSSSEIIDKNIKDLMPHRFSKDHDDYLYNYLTTGIKKVIGSGRKGFGLTKTGGEFPLYISVSEVLEDGFHLFTGIVRDLTDEVARQKLAQAEEDCLPQMIWKCDVTGQAQALNKRFMAYAGVSEENIKAVNVFSADVVHKEDFNESTRVFNEAQKTQQTFEVKRRVKAADGSYKWFLTRASPIFHEDGRISAWCGSCTDVDETEKLQYELAVLPESLPQCLWKIDLKGDVLYSNTKFQKFLGITKDTKGVNVFAASVVHPEDHAASRAIFDNALKTKSSFETNRRLKSAKGHYNWFMTRGSPVLDMEGNLTCFYGTCTDINEQREQQQELTALPESLPQMVWKINARGDVQYCNSKFLTYVGAKKGDALNVFSDKVVHKDDIKQSLTVFLQANKDKKEFTTGRRLKGADGLYKKFVTRGVPVINAEGVVTYWYGTCTEVKDE